ncbi:hypothetical protein BKH40_08170 [Helicobacter sp. 11S02629-2]|nr:hypothetical protein BKH40_08170 [Helicobacter sp. 11S02629-2]
MGSFGRDFASFNLSLFGYLAYIYLPLLLYPLFRIYKNASYSFRKVELTLGYLILFVSLLILQAISFHKGELALNWVSHLLPYIGLFGVIIVCIFGLLISYVLIHARGFFILSNLISRGVRKLILWLGSVRRVLGARFASFSDFSFGGFFTKAFSRREKEPFKDSFKEPLQDNYDKADYEKITPLSVLSDMESSQSYETTKEAFEESSHDIDYFNKPFDSVFIKTSKEDSGTYERLSNEDLVRKVPASPSLKEKFVLPPLKVDYEPRTINNLSRQDERIVNALSDNTSPYPYEDFSPPKEEEPKEGLVTFIPNPKPLDEDRDDIAKPFTKSNLEYSTSQSTQKDTKTIYKKDYIEAQSSKDVSEDSSKDFDLEETLNEARALKEALLSRQDEDLEKLSLDESTSKEVDLEKDLIAKGLVANNLHEVKELSKLEEVKEDKLDKNSLQTKPASTLAHTKDIKSNDKTATSTLDTLPQSTAKSMAALVTSLSENESFIEEAKDGASLKNIGYKLPSLSLLQEPKFVDSEVNEQEIDNKIRDLISKLNVFKIKGDVVRVYSGPVVTTFEFRPDPDIKVTKILSLQDDLAMTLKAKSLRMQAPIPGKDVVGIEVPNSVVQTIYLKEILESEPFKESKGALTIALGKDIVGNPFIANLEKLPHLLVAGTTGSGKSVGVSAIIISLLYRNSPDNLKFIMIDPKKVEFEPYEDIPHLITPIINNPEKAVLALAAATREMDKRYDALAKLKCKNIASYNEKADSKMPFLVIVIDELADLIMTGGKDVEFSIARIAQMGRACGMHLIVATQRSSTDVVTGLIKTNLPSRISYKVGNRIDSKVILDAFGAERLLGNGDGLFTPPGGGLVRIHAPWISEKEIEDIINYIKSEREVIYDENFLGEDKASQDVAVDRFTDSEGEKLLEAAIEVILSEGKTSISFVQRRLGIGYNKAALLMEALEARGFLSAPNSKNERTINYDYYS